MHVLGEQEGPFLRAGWTEVEGFARKGAEILELAFRIGALDAGDTPGVISAKNELLNRLGDPLDTESAVDDSELAFVLFRDALNSMIYIYSNGTIQMAIPQIVKSKDFNFVKSIIDKYQEQLNWKGKLFPQNILLFKNPFKSLVVMI